MVHGYASYTHHYLLFRSVFQMGPSSLSVPMSMFADNRRRLCDKLKEGGEVTKGAIVLLQGGRQECFNNTDIDVLFRQVCH